MSNEVSSTENVEINEIDSTVDADSSYRNEGPRNNYLEWDEFFMAAAFLTAQRSKDPVTQVGACLVNKNNIIVGMGYNGMPNGCNDNKFPWGKKGPKLETKYMYVCHAEMNAVLNKNCSDLSNCRIYVGLFPCNECTKILIQSGIKEIIFLSDKHSHKEETIASKRMLIEAGIPFRQFIPPKDEITIKFSDINWNNMSQLP